MNKCTKNVVRPLFFSESLMIINNYYLESQIINFAKIAASFNR